MLITIIYAKRKGLRKIFFRVPKIFKLSPENMFATNWGLTMVATLIVKLKKKSPRLQRVAEFFLFFFAFVVERPIE